MFREFWARSANFGQNGGWDESRRARRDFSATSQRPIFTKFGHETYFSVRSRNPRHFGKFSLQGSFAPKIESLSNRHLSQSRLQVMGCTADILFIPRSSPRVREFPRSVNFSLRRAGATGRQSCPIFGFWHIFPTQNSYLKRTFR